MHYAVMIDKFSCGIHVLDLFKSDGHWYEDFKERPLDVWCR
jgi:hypothetical protein